MASDNPFDNLLEYSKGVGDSLLNTAKEGAYGVYDFGQVAVGGAKILAKEGLAAVGATNMASRITIDDIEPVSALGKIAASGGYEGLGKAVVSMPANVAGAVKDAVVSGNMRDLGRSVTDAVFLAEGARTAVVGVAKTATKGASAVKAAVRGEGKAATKTEAGTGAGGEPSAKSKAVAARAKAKQANNPNTSNRAGPTCKKKNNRRRRKSRADKRAAKLKAQQLARAQQRAQQALDHQVKLMDRNALFDAQTEMGIKLAQEAVPPQLAAGAVTSGTAFNAVAAATSGHMPSVWAVTGSTLAGGIIGKFGPGLTKLMEAQLARLPEAYRLPVVRGGMWGSYLSAVQMFTKGSVNGLFTPLASTAGGFLNTLGPTHIAPALQRAADAGMGYFGKAWETYKAVTPTVAGLGVAAGLTLRPELTSQIIGAASLVTWTVSRTPTKIGAILNTEITAPSRSGSAMAPWKGQGSGGSAGGDASPPNSIEPQTTNSVVSPDASAAGTTNGASRLDYFQ